MTIEEMRDLVSLPPEATDAAVVAAYAALIDDGLPASIEVSEPVTVEQARLQCRIDDDIEDDLIAQKIRAAREWVEDYTGRVFAQQTLVEHFTSWGSYLEIAKRPIVSVDAIAYDGEDGAATLTDAVYSIGARPLRIFAANSFPTLRRGGGITVAYTAGYDAGEAPHTVVEAILVLVGGMLSEREGGYGKSVAAATTLIERLRTQII